MFVDPERDFIVRRIEEKKAGELLSELDITYSDDSQFGSLLTGWSRRQFDGSGRLLSSLEIAIARQEFNLTVSSDAFQIEFPPLTLVTVRGPRNEEPERFLVLKNGTHRPVTADEWRRAEATPSLLAVTAPREAGKPQRRGRLTMAWVIGIILLATVVILGVKAQLARKETVQG